MIEALRQFLNRRYWRRRTFAVWYLQCDCQLCSFHHGRCPFPENGERYAGHGSVVGYCTACALNREDIRIDRLWGKGHGAQRWWKYQQEACGPEGVFR